MKATLIILATFVAVAIGGSDKKVVCYFDSRALDRKGEGRFDLSYLQPNLCTHIIYTYIGLNDNGELADDPTKHNVTNFVEHVKHLRSDTKLMISTGGWNQGIDAFIKISAEPKFRRKFAANVVSYLKKYDLDGFDLDWEYPVVREGGSHVDKKNFYMLLQVLKQALGKENLILSAAVGATWRTGKFSYNISKISESVDFINLMTFDMHTWKEGKTGENAPLYAGSWEANNDVYLNVDAAVHYWIKEGAPAEKLVLGLAFYGQTFTLTGYAITRPTIGSPCQGPGNPGQISNEGGILDYIEICQLLKDNNWTIEYDKDQEVPYASLGNMWIGYDNEDSIKEKVRYTYRKSLGGVMVRSIEKDDFLGKCGDKFPLLKAVSSEIYIGASQAS